MTDRSVRVWAEEVEPPSTLRFTWQLEDDDGSADPGEDIARRLRATEGVLAVDDDGEGLLVIIDPEQVTRYRLAAEIRRALGAEESDADEEAPSVARVWAEDLAEDRMRITWKRVDERAADGDSLERRRVAAWISAMSGVRSATPDAEGVMVRYRPNDLDRPSVGNAVRNALSDETPLRQRADDLMRRSPTYGKLAQRLAMDERVSPLPDAAKSAISNRGRGGPAGSMARTTALRFIPGAAMITRIQMLLPVLQELSSWSRNADPAIVEEHLSAVGLTREVLKQDTVTAHEIRYYARDFAADATADLADKATEGARRAISTGRNVFAQIREAAATEPRESSAEQSPEDDESAGSERRPD